jgi:hypothetical protein
MVFRRETSASLRKFLELKEDPDGYRKVRIAAERVGAGFNDE